MKRFAYLPIDELADWAIDCDLLTEGREPNSEAGETERYDSLNCALVCLVEDYHLSGIDTQEDNPRLFR